MPKLDSNFFYKVGSLDFVKDESAGGMKYFVGTLSSTSLDLDGERLTKSALDMASKDLLMNTTVFFNHNHTGLGVGRIFKTEVVKDAEKHLLKIWVQPSKAAGVQDIVTQVEEGILKCMSIGGKTLKREDVYDKNLDKNVGELREVMALEASVVGIGANRDAMIDSIAKSYSLKGDSLEEDSLEKARLAASANDDPKEVKGDGGEVDEKKPIVPPKKKKAVDGEEVDDDPQHEEAKKKGKKAEKGEDEEKGVDVMDVQKDLPKEEVVTMSKTALDDIMKRLEAVEGKKSLVAHEEKFSSEPVLKEWDFGKIYKAQKGFK
jgi:HK97 family phage prohead protease